MTLLRRLWCTLLNLHTWELIYEGERGDYYICVHCERVQRVRDGRHPGDPIAP
jgi:hypothetical protein